PLNLNPLLLNHSSVSPFYNQCLLSRLSFFWVFKDYILRTRSGKNNLYSLDPREKTEYYVFRYRQFLSDRSDQSKIRRISLAMFYSQWKSYLLMVIYSSLFFVNSYFAFKILVGIQHYNQINDKFNYYTYCLFYMILFISIGITNCNNNLKAQKISNKAYSLVINEIYEKILYMGRTRQSKSSDSIYSRVVNHISSDLQIFTQNFNSALLFFISLIFQFAGSLAYAFQILSEDLLYGLAAFLLLIIPNIIMFRLYLRNILKTSKIRDTRLKQLSEMISGIRTIKLLMWTDYVSDKIAAIRNNELKRLRSAFRYLIGQRFFFEISTISIIYVPLFVYYLKNKNQATNIVVVNYVLSILGVSSSFIILLISVIGFSLSFESRVVEFLNSKFDDNEDERSDKTDETAKKQDKIHQASEKSGEIRFTANEYRWPEKLNGNKNSMISDNEFILKIPELIIDNAMLIGIVGRVGCGKTALFESIIGRMTPANAEGAIEVKGNLSICPQECWIFSDSLIENIKLGELIDAIKYKKILQNVCLKEDLELFPEGGNYRLTENGANISGGQRQRVNLARCMYRNADIYLLDDPLSALDDQVAERVFTSCIRGPNAYLQSKTILMTVSSEKFAAQCDKLLFMDDGEIVEFNEASEILKKYKSQLFKERSCETPTIRRDLLVGGNNIQVPSWKSLSFSTSIDNSVLVSGSEEAPKDEDTNTSVLPPLKFFGRFAKRYLSALFIFYLLGVSARILLFYINAEMFKTDDLIVWSLKGEWSLLLSLIIRSLVLLLPLILSSLFQIAMIHLTKKWHSILLNRVISWPLIEFEERTTGEITNNFSSDLTTIELSLTRSLSELSSSLMIFPGLVIYFSLKIPVLVVLAVLILLINFLFIYYYIVFITKIRQLELKGVGPIFNNIRETISGNKLVTIFGIEGFFRNKLTKNLDDLLLIKDIIANTIP
ncbi:MAG: Canalicular multispecific organic anion transporter 2, variant 2, partial [Marteilia pararefringens]